MTAHHDRVVPPGFGVRQSSAALASSGRRVESGRGLPHSKSWCARPDQCQENANERLQNSLNLVPYPRSLQREAGFFNLPAEAELYLEEVDLPAALRLQEAATSIGSRLKITAGPQEAITCRVSKRRLSGHSSYR